MLPASWKLPETTPRAGIRLPASVSTDSSDNPRTVNDPATALLSSGFHLRSATLPWPSTRAPFLSTANLLLWKLPLAAAMSASSRSNCRP